MSGPNALRVALSILRSRRVARPDAFGTETVDHSRLKPVLDTLATGGTAALTDVDEDLAAYCDQLALVNPTELSRDEALAFWLNLYNAGALRVAARALREGMDSVLRVPGGFETTMIDIAGEELSLEDIEHGKIRRFRDPRIQSALVCGSVSCPTLRSVPYTGADLDVQLDSQMRSFLDAGAAAADLQRGVIRLSRVFLWYGGDFTRPYRMPTWLPARRSRLVEALRPWMSPPLATWTGHPRVEFQSYDWGLRCAVGE